VRRPNFSNHTRSSHISLHYIKDLSQRLPGLNESVAYIGRTTAFKKQRPTTHQSDHNQEMDQVLEELVSGKQVEAQKPEHHIPPSSKRRWDDREEKKLLGRSRAIESASDIQSAERGTREQQRDRRFTDGSLPSNSSLKRGKDLSSDSTHETLLKTAEIPHQGPLRECSQDPKTRQYRDVNINVKAPRLVIAKSARSVRSARSANIVKPRVQYRQALKQAWTRDHGSPPQVSRDRWTTIHGSSENAIMIPKSDPPVDIGLDEFSHHEGRRPNVTPSRLVKTAKPLLERTCRNYDSKILAVHFRLLMVSVPIWLLTLLMSHTTNPIPRCLTYFITWSVWAFLTLKT
jgi:hypothetical protein